MVSVASPVLVLTVGNGCGKQVLTLVCSGKLAYQSLFTSAYQPNTGLFTSAYQPAYQLVPTTLYYLVGPTDHLAALEKDIVNANPPKAKRDPHAGDKRELAASHKGKKLPVEEPEKHEGKPITSESIQKMAEKRGPGSGQRDPTIYFRRSLEAVGKWSASRTSRRSGPETCRRPARR